MAAAMPTDKLGYLGSVTLTPYHTQSMLPWVLADIQTRSAQAGAKLECFFSFDETTLRLFSDEDDNGDHCLVLSHPILSICRFVHPRLPQTSASPSDTLPTFAYLEKQQPPPANTGGGSHNSNPSPSNHNSYKIHAFQCVDRAQIESFVKLLSSALEAALAVKSEREISGGTGTGGRPSDYHSTLNSCVFRLVASGPVPTRTLTSINVDEIINSTRLPGGGKNSSSPVLTHVRLAPVDTPSVLRTGLDCLYLVSHLNTPKQSVIARRYIDVTGCSLGKVHSEAMAIVCRENQASVCYCLQSDDPEITFMMSQKVAELVKHSLKALQANKVAVCAHCPMNAFNDLCRQLETLDDTSINSAIRSKFEAVVGDLQKELCSGSSGSGVTLAPHSQSTAASPSESVACTPTHRRNTNTSSNQHPTSTPGLVEQRVSLGNEAAMMSLLRQHFECLQQKHQHVSDYPGAALVGGGMSGGVGLKGGLLGNINKARKAVQGSLQDIKHMKNEIVEEASSSLLFSLPQKSMVGSGQLAGAAGDNGALQQQQPSTGAVAAKRWKQTHMGGLERQLKVLAGRIANGPNAQGAAAEEGEGEEDPLEWLSAGHSGGISSKVRRTSIPVFRGIPTWRQDIYTLVTTPIKKCALEPVGVVGYDNVLEIPMHFTDTSPLDVQLSQPIRLQQQSRRDFRALWKRVILDQILLIRMEKANSSLKACQDRVANRRCKLDFDDTIGGLGCPDELGEVWHDLLSRQQVEELTYDYVFAAVKSGIPKGLRGEAWKLLSKFNMHRLTQSHVARARSLHALDSNSNCLAGQGQGEGEGEENGSVVTPLSALQYEYDYASLIRKKSKQQNDIFLDLDRTFPGHPYFAEKYGLGQLALYNVLRAYSIIDDDVGYCQGMSFVASVLLMHVSEQEAFHLLRFLMHALNLRRQYRPPNMTGLQVKQYQLQRLLHDRLPKLHWHLQKLEMPPTLYATAWFLTLFSSQFPLGLVVRLFDLVFLDGPDSVFKLAIVILSKFEYLLLSQSSFEAVVGVFKNQLPNLVSEHAADIIKATLDSTSFEHLDKQLFAYEVEYQVMREEEIMNSPVAGGGASASARGAQSGSVPKSGTSVDLASAGLRSEKEHNSSVQKHNEFCLEKVAALNKKLERDKYALELKAQQLKQQTYDLQDQVAAMQREEFQLHSAIVQLVQEREMLLGLLSRQGSFATATPHQQPRHHTNDLLLHSSSPHPHTHPHVNGGDTPTSDITQAGLLKGLPFAMTTSWELQLCNLSEMLPEKVLQSCRKTVNVCASNNTSVRPLFTHNGLGGFVNSNNDTSAATAATSGGSCALLPSKGASLSGHQHQCNGQAS